MKKIKFIKIKQKNNNHCCFFNLNLLEFLTSEPNTQNNIFFAILKIKNCKENFMVYFNRITLVNFEKFLEDDSLIFEFIDFNSN